MTEFTDDFAKPDRPVEEIDKSLVQEALENLRALFRGNGLKSDQLEIAAYKGEIVNFEAYGIYKLESVIGEKHVAGKEGGEIAGSYTDAQQRIKAALEKISLDKDLRALTATILKKRPDLGFAVSNLLIGLERYAKKFVIHEPCAPCDHSGKILCQACQGRGQVVCTKCHGSREIPCHVCHGTQFINTAQGRVQCLHCHGRGRIRCPLCNQTGMLQCQKCKTTGRMPCNTCAGTGWNSHVFNVAVKAKGHFDYNRDLLPPELVELIDAYGPELVTGEHAHVRIIDDQRKNQEMDRLSKEDEFIIPYHAKLPWADVDFWIKSEKVGAKLFGYTPYLHNLPPVLEQTVAGARRHLAAAAEGRGNVSRLVSDAVKCRLIGEAVLGVLRLPAKRAAAMLRSRYPYGISDEALRSIVLQAKSAIANLTRKPRLQGIAAGSLVVCMLFASWFIGPARAAVLQQAGAALPGLAIDIVMLAAAGGLHAALIHFMAARSLKEALGRLRQTGKGAAKLAPSPADALLWGYGATLLTFVLILALAALRGQAPPWLGQFL